MSEKGSHMPDTPEQPPRNSDSGGITPAPESKGLPQQPEFPSRPLPLRRPSSPGRVRGSEPSRSEAKRPKTAPEPSKPDANDGSEPPVAPEPPEAVNKPTTSPEEPTSEGKKEITPPQLTPDQEAQRAAFAADVAQRIDSNPETAKFSEEQKAKLAFTLSVFGNPEITAEELQYFTQGADNEVIRQNLANAGNPNADALMSRLEQLQQSSSSEEPAPEPEPEPEPKRELTPLTDEQQAQVESILPIIEEQLANDKKLAEESGLTKDNGDLDPDLVRGYAEDLIRLNSPETSLEDLQLIIDGRNLNRQEVTETILAFRPELSDPTTPPAEVQRFIQTLDLDRRAARKIMEENGRSPDEVTAILGDMDGLTDEQVKEQVAFDELSPEQQAELKDFKEEFDDLQEAAAGDGDKGELKERAAGLWERFKNWREKESSRHILMNTWTIAFFSALIILLWTIRTGGNAFAGAGKRR